MVGRPWQASAISFNVAGLLADAPGARREHVVEGITLDLESDFQQAEPLVGDVRVSRTNRGILVAARLTTSLAAECGRCLTPVTVPLDLRIDAEALPSIDPRSGSRVEPDENEDGTEVLRLTEHHELDLEQAVREAISLAEPIAPVCRPDCPGLCSTCGEPLTGPAHDHDVDDLDPRFAALRAFVVDGDGQTE